jgi:hypothetical protein
MPRGLPQPVKDNLEKCRSAAIAAVDSYNRPGPRFRTAQFLVLISIAWVALFHAIFYRRNKRPWYREKEGGKGGRIRYVKIDGDPKHWDLLECARQYYGDQNPPERKNVEFIIGLRNKVEHRHLPNLDPTLYGECQASLLNLEATLVKEFGPKYALTEQLAISLQFSHAVPEEKAKAAKLLATSAAKSVKEYIETFRANLGEPTLNSMKYSYNVFLVPRVVNRQSASDAAIQFVKMDEANPEELSRLDKLNVLIREKRVPITNLGLFKPGEVVAELNKRFPGSYNMTSHTEAWKKHKVRPSAGDAHPERTRSEYCVYDEAHEDYLYTNAWVEMLAGDLDG